MLYNCFRLGASNCFIYTKGACHYKSVITTGIEHTLISLLEQQWFLEDVLTVTYSEYYGQDILGKKWPDIQSTLPYLDNQIWKPLVKCIFLHPFCSNCAHSLRFLLYVGLLFSAVIAPVALSIFIVSSLSKFIEHFYYRQFSKKPRNQEKRESVFLSQDSSHVLPTL